MPRIWFLILLLLSFTSNGDDTVNSPDKNFSIEMPSSGPMSEIHNWKQLYFVGISKKNPDSINISAKLIDSLFNMIGVKSYISTGLAISPEYVVTKTNDRVISSWLSLFAVPAHYNPETISRVYKGEGAVFLSDKWSKGLFKKNTGWPAPLLEKYDWDLKGYNLFVMPFLVPSTTGELKDFSQSMKLPDGSLEIFWFSYFNAGKPDNLLLDVSNLKNFIEKERKELLHSD